MGERMSLPAWRQRLATWMMPEYGQRLEEITNEVQGLTLHLERTLRQNRQLVSDRGQYRDRWENLALGDYNPEEINLSEYKKMMNYDSQVVAGFDLIQMGTLMKTWKIAHEDPEIVKILTDSLSRMQYPNFRNAMKEMLKAIAYGFSVTEVVFDDYKGKYWVPREQNGLKTFDPETITFFSDEFGNLQQIQQWRMLSRATGPSRGSIFSRQISLPLDRTIIWTHEREWGNWYGKSILRGCYKNWFIKDAMLKFANIAYERFGSPILLGIVSTGSDLARMQADIKRLYARSQAVIIKRDNEDPADIKVLESKRTEMPFDRYIRYQDEMILRRMLIGQKVFEGGGGTYGPKVGLDLIFMRLEDFRLELTSSINELLKTITDLNWFVDEYPKIQFAPLTTQDQADLARGIYDAIDRGLVDPTEKWIRQMLGYPPKGSGDEKEKSEKEVEQEE